MLRGIGAENTGQEWLAVGLHKLDLLPNFDLVGRLDDAPRTKRADLRQADIVEFNGKAMERLNADGGEPIVVGGALEILQVGIVVRVTRHTL